MTYRLIERRDVNGKIVQKTIDKKTDYHFVEGDKKSKSGRILRKTDFGFLIWYPNDEEIQENIEVSSAEEIADNLISLINAIVENGNAKITNAKIKNHKIEIEAEIKNEIMTFRQPLNYIIKEI